MKIVILIIIGSILGNILASVSDYVEYKANKKR